MYMNLEYEIRRLFEDNVRTLQNDGWVNPKLIILSEEYNLTADPYDLSDPDLALQVIRGQAKTAGAYMVSLSYSMTLEAGDSSILKGIYAHGETEFERMGMYQEYRMAGDKMVLLGKPVRKVLENDLTGFFI